MIQLDPSFVIRASIAGSPEGEKLSVWVKKNAEITMSAVAWAEFLCGPLSPAQAALAARIVGRPLAFSAADATRAAVLFNATGRRRSSMRDCMIAAAALGAGASLATSNREDFDRFEGLEILTA